MTLMESFVNEQIQAEEFVTQYLELRRELLAKADEIPPYKEESQTLIVKFRSGAISRKHFLDESKRITHKYWPQEYANLKPYTVVGDLLASRLMVAVDPFDAPTYGAYSIDEDELRRIVGEILETVEREKQKGNL
jgi:hypothetical protein